MARLVRAFAPIWLTNPSAGSGARMIQQQGVQDGIQVEQDGDQQVSITRVHVVSPWVSRIPETHGHLYNHGHASNS